MLTARRRPGVRPVPARRGCSRWPQGIEHAGSSSRRSVLARAAVRALEREHAPGMCAACRATCPATSRATSRSGPTSSRCASSTRRPAPALVRELPGDPGGVASGLPVQARRVPRHRSRRRRRADRGAAGPHRAHDRARGRADRGPGHGPRRRLHDPRLPAHAGQRSRASGRRHGDPRARRGRALPRGGRRVSPHVRVAAGPVGARTSSPPSCAASGRSRTSPSRTTAAASTTGTGSAGPSSPW